MWSVIISDILRVASVEHDAMIDEENVDSSA
jgi:hypothetical protein